MRYLTLSLTALVLTTACSREHQTRPAPAPVGFLDKVWTVVESPGGSGELYVFLSDGTFVKAVKDGGPAVGKWSWDGEQLTVVEDALPYTVDIDSLAGDYLKLTVHFMDRDYVVGLATATASMPDTTDAVEFDPTQASISAHGSDPVWLLHIDGDRATLRIMGKTESYVDGEWTQQEPSYWDYDARRTIPSGEAKLDFHLSTSMCVDSTSGAQYPLVAILARDGKTLFGCALATKLPATSQ